MAKTFEYKGISFYVNRQLKAHFEKNSLSRLRKANIDRVYIVDGTEGSGKSFFAMQMMAVLEPTLLDNPEKFVDRIVFTPEDFLDKVRTIKNGVIIFDEAFRGLSSRSALSKVNRQLVQALMEMRQQNNIVFIVLPSFFMLDIYPAMLRSNGLFNIYVAKDSGRRIWQGYNKQDKNRLYQQGIKKGWNYFVRTKFRDYFFGSFPKGEFLEFYLRKKAKALREMNKESYFDKRKVDIEPNEVKIYRAMYEKLKSYRKLEAWAKEQGVDRSYVWFRDLLTQQAKKTAQIA